jgi:hypothetical protein
MKDKTTFVGFEIKIRLEYKSNGGVRVFANVNELLDQEIEITEHFRPAVLRTLLEQAAKDKSLNWS